MTPLGLGEGPLSPPDELMTREDARTWAKAGSKLERDTPLGEALTWKGAGPHSDLVTPSSEVHGGHSIGPMASQDQNSLLTTLPEQKLAKATILWPLPRGQQGGLEK